MKALSEQQATRCENAKTARCRCRCGGVLHGAARGEVAELPAEDPHRPAEPRWAQGRLVLTASEASER